MPTNKGVDSLSQTTANAIWMHFQSGDSKELKAELNSELKTMLQEGKISREEYEAAVKFIKKEGNLMDALAARNRVEGNTYGSIVYGDGSLPDEKADKLMKDCKLEINDLYEAVHKFAGLDYKVSDKANLNPLKKSANGSEIENIRSYLNDIIKKNGGDKELTKKETAFLMKGLGADVGKTDNVPAFAKFLLRCVGLSVAGAVQIQANGDFLSVGINESKASKSEQDTRDGGEGSVTNKTEAKMGKLSKKSGTELDTET